MSNKSEQSGWFGWFFTDKKGVHSGQGDTHVGYHRMEDTAEVQSTRLDAMDISRRPARADSVYGYGYSTYQMDAPPGSYDYDLQLKRKEGKPKVNSLWARLKYWVRYTWKMFKVGLMASGQSMSNGPMMAPPPMASVTSRMTRHRVSEEPYMPNVYM